MAESSKWVTVATRAADAIVEQYPDGQIPEKDEAMLVIALCQLVAHFAAARKIDPTLVILTLLKSLTEQGMVEQVPQAPMVADNGRVH